MAVMAICDPFLCTRHDVISPVLAFLSGRLNVSYIRTSIRLRNGYTYTFAAIEEIWEELLLQRGAAEFEDGRGAEGQADSEGSTGPTEA